MCRNTGSDAINKSPRVTTKSRHSISGDSSQIMGFEVCRSHSGLGQTTADGDQNEENTELLKCLRSSSQCMLTTLSEDGLPCSEPVDGVGAVSGASLQLLLNADSISASNLAHNPHANVSFASKYRRSQGTVAGLGTLLPSRIGKLPGMTTEVHCCGLKEPLQVLHIDLQVAQLWMGEFSVWERLLGLLVMIVTGEPADRGVDRYTIIFDPVNSGTQYYPLPRRTF